MSVIESERDELSKTESIEFFHDNMSMLGFENQSRSIYMSVKEAVDNSLDSCNEIEVLPDIDITLEDTGDYILLDVEDNGAGIPPEHIQDVFTQPFFGSRFGVRRQSRGQQGLGISAVSLYSQKHLNVPIRVETTTYEDDMIHVFEISLKRKGEVDSIEHTKEETDKDHGTRVSFPLKGSWRARKHIEKYLEGTSIANPSSRISYSLLGEKSFEDKNVVYERTSKVPEVLPEETKPHPESMDLSTFEDIIENTDTTTLKSFLQNDFVSVGPKSSQKIIDESGIDGSISPDDISSDDIQKIIEGISNVSLIRPPTDSLSPLGEDLIEKSLSLYNPQEVGSVTRNPIVVNGHPFVVEVGIGYGGEIDSGKVDLHRVSNKVPLVYDRGNCDIWKAMNSVNWNDYELNDQPNALPEGPAVIFVHVCSTHVPFGNKAKTYVSGGDEIIEEIKLALQQCGRDYAKFIKKKRRKQERQEKVTSLLDIYPQISDKLGEVLDKKSPDYLDSLGSACDMLVYDEDTCELRNPTDESKRIEIDGDDKKIESGNSVIVYNRNISGEMISKDGVISEKNSG